MNKVTSVCSVKRRLFNVYDYFIHLRTSGLIDNFSEDEQRLFRSVFSDLENMVSADWTTNYY